MGFIIRLIIHLPVGREPPAFDGFGQKKVNITANTLNTLTTIIVHIKIITLLRLSNLATCKYLMHCV
jgi:hypothetical protein